MKLHLAARTAARSTRTSSSAQTLAEINMPSEIVMRHRTPQFGHVFSGDGYSAGYYSYLWSDTLTADAWEAFLENSGPWDHAGHWLTQACSPPAIPSTRPRPTASSAVAMPSIALMRKRGFPVPARPAPATRQQPCPHAESRSRCATPPGRLAVTQTSARPPCTSGLQSGPRPWAATPGWPASTYASTPRSTGLTRCASKPHRGRHVSILGAAVADQQRHQHDAVELGRGAQAVRDLEAVHCPACRCRTHHLGLERGRELGSAQRGSKVASTTLPVEAAAAGQARRHRDCVVDDQHPPRRRARTPMARRLGRGDCDPRQADLEVLPVPGRDW